ncbi:MAG TPA: stage II sporulation protein M [Chthoniobacteraceae bacterium]|jgi:uncharacterized membrane protein SpoIIM required for sporulation|nr:stage II sporulation protein M [Chthoniobacteraceae bacterium]
MIIDLARFIDAGRPAWSELEQTLDRLDADPAHQMTFDQLRHFYALYQRVSADLAKIQTFASEPDICRYLESLTARAYAEIHEVREKGPRRGPLEWFLRDFPAVFRRHIRAFQLSLIITLAGAVFGAGAVYVDKDAKAAIFPGQFSHLLGDPAKRVKEEEHQKTDRLKHVKATFSASLMQNNIHVSIMLLALGMTWGLGTIVLLFYNGVILGAVMLDYLRAGQSAFLFGWLLPHGVIEIPATVIAGQAGLLIGKALLGGRDRTTVKERFRALGPDLMTLIGGVAVMLVWAGIIESFFSQYHEPVIPYAVKIVFGITELILLTWFLNRRRAPKESQ